MPGSALLAQARAWLWACHQTDAAEIEIPGNNLIEIYAREGAEVVATRRMWVLRTTAPTPRSRR